MNGPAKTPRALPANARPINLPRLELSVTSPIRYIPAPIVREEPIDCRTLAIAQVHIVDANALSQQNENRKDIPIAAVIRGPTTLTNLPVTILNGSAMIGLMQYSKVALCFELPVMDTTSSSIGAIIYSEKLSKNRHRKTIATTIPRETESERHPGCNLGINFSLEVQRLKRTATLRLIKSSWYIKN